MKKKPRSKICWHCGRKLFQGKVFVEMEIDGHPRILHKQCAKDIEYEFEMERNRKWHNWGN